MGLFVCTRIAKHLLGTVITLLFHNTVAIRKLTLCRSLSYPIVCVCRRRRPRRVHAHARARPSPPPPGRVYVRSSTPAVALTNFTTPS